MKWDVAYPESLQLHLDLALTDSHISMALFGSNRAS